MTSSTLSLESGKQILDLCCSGWDDPFWQHPCVVPSSIPHKLLVVALAPVNCCLRLRNYFIEKKQKAAMIPAISLGCTCWLILHQKIGIIVVSNELQWGDNYPKFCCEMLIWCKNNFDLEKEKVFFAPTNYNYKPDKFIEHAIETSSGLNFDLYKLTLPKIFVHFERDLSSSKKLTDLLQFQPEIPFTLTHSNNQQRNVFVQLEQGAVYPFVGTATNERDKLMMMSHLTRVYPGWDTDEGKGCHAFPPFFKYPYDGPGSSRLREFNMPDNQVQYLGNQVDGFAVEESVFDTLRKVCEKLRQPVFLFHGYVFTESTINQEGKEQTETPLDADFILVHRRLGVALIEVKKNSETSKSMQRNMNRLSKNLEFLRTHFKIDKRQLSPTECYPNNDDKKWHPDVTKAYEKGERHIIIKENYTFIKGLTNGGDGSNEDDLKKFEEIIWWKAKQQEYDQDRDTAATVYRNLILELVLHESKLYSLVDVHRILDTMAFYRMAYERQISDSNNPAINGHKVPIVDAPASGWPATAVAPNEKYSTAGRWLYMNPEQVAVWKGGCLQYIRGPLGSGKTILLQHKALELLKSGNTPVVVLTTQNIGRRYNEFFRINGIPNQRFCIITIQSTDPLLNVGRATLSRFLPCHVFIDESHFAYFDMFPELFLKWMWYRKNKPREKVKESEYYFWVAEAASNPTHSFFREMLTDDGKPLFQVPELKKSVRSARNIYQCWSRSEARSTEHSVEGYLSHLYLVQGKMGEKEFSDTLAEHVKQEIHSLIRIYDLPQHAFAVISVTKSLPKLGIAIKEEFDKVDAFVDLSFSLFQHSRGEEKCHDIHSMEWPAVVAVMDIGMEINESMNLYYDVIELSLSRAMCSLTVIHRLWNKVITQEPKELLNVYMFKIYDAIIKILDKDKDVEAQHVLVSKDFRNGLNTGLSNAFRELARIFQTCYIAKDLTTATIDAILADKDILHRCVVVFPLAPALSAEIIEKLCHPCLRVTAFCCNVLPGA